MIYNDRERLSISIVLSLILFLTLFLVFDYLSGIEFTPPQVVRPPLIVSFYAERPAPLGEETKEEPAAKQPPPPQKKEPVTRQRPAAKAPSTSTASSTEKVRHNDNATDYVSDLPPVDWGDDTKANEPFIPDQNEVQYGENAPITDRSVQSSSPTVEIVEETSRVDGKLSQIQEKEISSNAGSSADGEGSNPSAIYSDSPMSLDEFTKNRELRNNPMPKIPEGALQGQKDLRIEVEFDINYLGYVSNLQFRTEIGYYAIEQAIKEALGKWRFESAPKDTPIMKVHMGFLIRAR